jgi:phosphoadenosine phosphosulfate reductase
MAETVRVIDRINTAPRFSESEAIRLNRLFRGTDTQDMLRSVLLDGLAGDVALVSSFGAESAVLLHLVSQINPAIPVLFLETGKHFPETLAYRDLLVERLGITAKDENGLRWSWDPDGCCDIRKVQPLAKALAGFDATITGRKGFQSATRAGLPRFEIDNTDAQGRLKINPLADWSAEVIAAYIAAHDLPAHPLVAEGYPSIGCSPCTSKVAAGEDARSGRWKGWDKTECGIHVPGAPDEELPPEFDPVF